MSTSLLESERSGPGTGSGWSLRYRNPQGQLGTMSRTGIAEIKPHKDAQIRRGLYQLRSYLFEMRHPTPRRVGSAWLLTYLPAPASGRSSQAGQAIQVIAHRIIRDRLLPRVFSQLPRTISSADVLKKMPPPPDLEVLTDYRAVLPSLQLPRFLPSTMPFPTLRHPDMFGLAVEDPIRKQFRERFGITVLKMPVTRADVQWELAQFYGELAQATGDPYWRELAKELAATGA